MPHCGDSCLEAWGSWVFSGGHLLTVGQTYNIPDYSQY